MPLPDDWVEKARAWTAATRRNEAMAPLAFDPQAAEFAGKISDLYMGLRSSAEDIATDARARMTDQRTNLLNQFADVDAANAAAMANSGNYMSAIAKQLGLEQALTDPALESGRQVTDRLNALNNTNRQNQLASFDLIRNTYGDMLNKGYLQFDNLAAQQLGTLYGQVQAARDALAAANARGGGGGGGGGGRGGRGRRGRGSSSGGGAGPGFMTDNPSTFIAINPYNPPSGSTYSSDYVRPDVQRRAPVPVKKPTKPTSYSSRAASQKAASTSRAYSLAHPMR